MRVGAADHKIHVLCVGSVNLLASAGSDHFNRPGWSKAEDLENGGFN